MEEENKIVEATENTAVEAKAEEIKDEPKVQYAGEKKIKICPECGNKIEYSEGCYICLNCGYSGCS